MKLTRLRCPNCGADFENIDVSDGQKVFTCTRLGCGASFILDRGIKFADIRQSEAEKISRYRSEMMDALFPFNRKLAAQNAESILSVLPDDFRAKAVLCLTDSWFEDKRPVESFLSARSECTPEEFEEVFPFLVSHCNYKVWQLLQSAIPYYIPDPSRQKQLREQMELRMETLLQENDLYAFVPRDVFVCHSSADYETVSQVVRELEKDGWK